VLDQVIMIVATAVLSCLLTVAVAAAFFRVYAARVEQRLEQRLHDKLAETAEEVGEAIEIRLRKVVRDAVGDFKSAGLAAGATRSVAITGAELVQEGLRILMGGSPKPPAGGSGS